MLAALALQAIEKLTIVLHWDVSSTSLVCTALGCVIHILLQATFVKMWWELYFPYLFMLQRVMEESNINLESLTHFIPEEKRAKYILYTTEPT